MDGSTQIEGGWINQHYVQLGYQLADSVAGFSYSFVLTCIILFLMNLVPGLSLRVSPAEEELGLDDGQLGEFAYDYVELRRHTTDTIAQDISIGHSPSTSTPKGIHEVEKGPVTFH